ncbi:MAG TPA: vanadium-dependent haloperoxidase, partial [Candidatus Dormibacteraeota bacterium]
MTGKVTTWKATLRLKALAAASAAAVAAGAFGISAGASTNHRSAHGMSPQVVLDWNVNAVKAVLGPPAKGNAEGLVYTAYAQAAVYDAVTKIAGRYVPYHNFDADTAGASINAAVVAAAYNTLVHYLGDPGLALKQKYDASLALLPDAGKSAGIAVGKAAADDIIAFRTGDGRNATITTPYGQCVTACPAGLWTFAPPPSAQSAATPWLGFMRPFMLTSPSQFRPGPPPSLSSDAYADEFNEVKAVGALNSTVRTPEQTAVAYFWIANVYNQYNKAFRDLITAHHMDLVDAARALAMANLVGADSAIACWDSKYFYQFWRPTMAIRNADIDGNPETIADPTWTPLLTTPNHPDYLSGHGCVTGAEAEVFAAVLSTKRISVDIPGAENGLNTLTTSRHYATVKQLLQEIVNARVWVGFHFRGSVEAGVTLGQQVSHWTLARFFRPIGDENDDQGDRGDSGGD